MFIQNWLHEKLSEVAKKLPNLVYTEPSSFYCGYNMGYKQAMLDLERIIEGGAKIYEGDCWCGDKYHEKGVRCL